ncbi:hypothetical protein RhiirA4_390344 [Rhizophagus irregularis]|uniref:Nucleoside transporter n=1 Tax=Rhizophagus irregularis TaxID=588596 RepID=A0A2I1FSN0_9GLOM|nr:hypothetical protein RhiirA4_390344 [Rhizophagus irregularis]
MYSRLIQLLNNVFGHREEEQAYTPILNHEGSSQAREDVPPRDNYRIVYLTFLLQGVTMLLGWNGLAGSAVAIFQILSALAAPPSTTFDTLEENDLSRSALLYFLCAFIIVILALISFYFILIRSPLYLHHREQARRVETICDINSIRATFDNIRILVFAVGFVFTVTLSVYPSITEYIKSTVKDENKNKFRQDYLFIPLHFLIFNLGDLLGRSLPSLQFFIITDSVKLARMSSARIIFLPLFLMCNVDIGSIGMRTFPLFINSDLIYFLILLLFAITNGYMGSLTMMAAPQVEGVARDLAGTIMSFGLVFGLLWLQSNWEIIGNTL